MGDEIASMALRWMGKLLKIVWKLSKPVLMWTGLLYPGIVYLIASLEPDWVIPIWIWVIAWMLCAYTFFQSCIRVFSKDKTFKLYRLVFKRSQSRSEKRKTNPKVNTGISFKTPSGVVFGRLKNRFVCKPENMDGHILVVGGPGSGKSAAIAIPTLLTWNDTVFAIDIKGELSNKTAHKRNSVKIFGLEQGDYGYNPFFLVNNKRNLVEQIKGIAVSLIPIPPEEKNPFWKQNAQNFLTGCLLWGYESEVEFSHLMKIIQTTPPKDMARAIMESSIEDAKLFANQFVNMAQETISGVYAEVSNTILPFASDEQLIAALSKSKDNCISPSDLDNGISIYIRLDEWRLEQLKNFLTLLVNQFLKHFEQRSEDADNRILFLLDEFARLGKIDSVMNGLATLRSKKITICLIFQSLAQLDVIYGRDQRKAIFDNCSFWALLRVSDPDTQKYFSDAIGTYDKTKKSFSDNQQNYKVGQGSSGTSTSTEEKRIIKPEDLNKLGDELILISEFGFNRLQKTFYFKDKYFQNLLTEDSKK